MRSSTYTLCLLVLALAVASPAVAGRHSQFEGRNHLYKVRQHASRISENAWGSETLSSSLRVLCIPTVSQTLEDHEGRHYCAYNHSDGFRAVGVGYNLDEDVDARRRELSTLFADYDKVYNGESCLWDIQITALLGLDSKRALDKAADSVEYLDDFCCDVQAVFADVQHSIGGASKSFPEKDFKIVIEKAALKEWGSAAHELNETNWCYDHQDRCEDNVAIVKSGCNSLFTIGS